jgi:hypothetical protein
MGKDFVSAKNLVPNFSDDDIHQARELRDAEVADPGIVRRTVDDALVRRAVKVDHVDRK